MGMGALFESVILSVYICPSLSLILEPTDAILKCIKEERKPKKEFYRKKKLKGKKQQQKKSIKKRIKKNC